MDKKIWSVLARLERQSLLEKARKIDVEPQKRMLAITPETARFYHKILLGIKARKILELGTSSGYSTLWFADAIMQNKPKIITIEKNSLKVRMAQANFEAAGVSDMIKIRHGQILDVLSKIPDKPVFDFVLIDADKENITKYFESVLPKTKVGGIIATDNVLLPAKYQKFMRKYTYHIRQNKHTVTGTIPLGYGQEITMRIG
jgi:caffeoyl-CoA O-methyltransferase